MTDERIKEEFDTWISDIECTDNEMLFFNQYPSIDQPTAVGFYAGFRTAERLAKIEELEYLRDKSEYKMNPEMYCFFSKRIAELKEEGE